MILKMIAWSVLEVLFATFFLGILIVWASARAVSETGTWFDEIAVPKEAFVMRTMSSADGFCSKLGMHEVTST